MPESTAKQAPPGYRCPGCSRMHRISPCFPGCGAAQDDDIVQLNEEVQ